MSHQLDERIRNHAAALDQAAPPIRLDDVCVSSRSVRNRRLVDLWPLRPQWCSSS